MYTSCFGPVLLQPHPTNFVKTRAMFNNDIRGGKLITELKEYHNPHARSLEYSVRANGSLRVTGLQQFKSRNLLASAHRWGKSFSVILQSGQSHVVVDFQDDSMWKGTGLLQTQLAMNGSADLSVMAAALDNDMLDGEVDITQISLVATHTLQVTACTTATITSQSLRSILALPMVVDILIYSDRLDVVVAKDSNLVGGLAHVGSMRGFTSNLRRPRPRHVHGSAVARATQLLGRLSGRATRARRRNYSTCSRRSNHQKKPVIK